MRRLLLFVVLIFITFACTKLDYIGEEYPPTAHVDQYFSEADIEVDYKIMGRIIATAGDMVSSGKMQSKIIEKAMEKGADGVLILGLERYSVSGPSSFTSVTETEEKKGKEVSTTTGISSSSSEDKKQVEAVFLKYR